MCKDETQLKISVCLRSSTITGIISSDLDELSGDQTNDSVMGSVAHLGVWLLTDRT